MPKNDSTVAELQDRVCGVFYRAFGRTPLALRIRDVFGEVLELSRYTDFANAKEETGDALASLIMLCSECEWPIIKLLSEYVSQIKNEDFRFDDAITASELQLALRQIGKRKRTEARIEDILKKAIKLTNHYDLESLGRAAGVLLASLIMMCNESTWSIADLLDENANKIERRLAQYKALGRKFRIAIEGGAFDPITRGHLQAGQFVLKAAGEFDGVHLMPCFRHMNGKHMAAPEHRLAMCRLAVQADCRIEVNSFEIDHELAGETFYLVRQLLDDPIYKDRIDASMIIGMDNANTFPTWYNYEFLEKMIQFVIVSRQGEKPDPKVDWYLRPPHIALVHEQNAIMDVSSTMVRGLIATGDESVIQFIDPSVFEYIKEHKLYGWPN